MSIKKFIFFMTFAHNFKIRLNEINVIIFLYHTIINEQIKFS